MPSLVLGYLVGLNSRRPARRHFTFKHGIITHKSDTTDDDVREREISSMSEDRNLDHDALAVDLSDECKFALVVRTDLGMTSGKIAAQ
ncbi:hypothetical protein H0H93_014427 [Arthromyces matolae]|nr:hypothetical protein H0H93_014427 [Arthromyces matolae]